MEFLLCLGVVATGTCKITVERVVEPRHRERWYQIVCFRFADRGTTHTTVFFSATADVVVGITWIVTITITGTILTVAKRK